MAAFIVVLGVAIFYDASHALSHHKPSNTTSPKIHSIVPSNQDGQLQQIVNNWGQQYSFNTTVVVQELTGKQRSAGLRPADSVVTASVFKLYVGYAVLRGAEQGNFNLADITSDGNTIQTDLNNMILNSDNDASRTLGFMVGWPTIDSELAGLGLGATNLNNYIGSSTVPTGDKHTTADDLSLFLQKLYAGSLLNASNTSMLLSLLEGQNYRGGIPAGVPSSIIVADKPGWLTPADGINEYVENDAGIIYGAKSAYVLVICTGGSSTRPLTLLSQQIYNYLES